MKKSEDYYSDYLYAVSIKEDTAYLCLHFNSNYEELRSNTSDLEDSIRRPTFNVEPLEKVYTDNEYNVFANDQEHTDQPKNMNDTSLMETDDCNTIPVSSNVCNNDFKDDQNADDQEDERRENASLNECKSALAESNDIRDGCRSALHNQEIELEKYKKPASANPKYLKKAQSEKPCLYKVPFDKDDLVNTFAPDSVETLILNQERDNVLVKNLLIPLAKKEKENAYAFEYALKKEVFEDLDELKKLIEKSKGKSVETKFDKPHVIRQTRAVKVPKPSVLSKSTPFSDSLEKRDFSKSRLIPKTDVSKGLSKPVTPQNLNHTQTRKQAEIKKNVIKPGIYRLDTMPTQPRISQLSQTSKNTNPRVFNSIGVIHKTSVSMPHLRSN
nr:hypothetical protein [Tanacetum cinerariifolium]